MGRCSHIVNLTFCFAKAAILHFSKSGFKAGVGDCFDRIFVNDYTLQV